MTAVKRIEAAIERFPFLEEHIVKFAEAGKDLKLDFLPYSPGLFFLRYQCMFFYNDNGKEIVRINSPVPVEHYVGDIQYRGVIIFVKITNDGIQVYLPPENCSSTALYMNKILEQERREGRIELEKTIAGLYKKEGQPNNDNLHRNNAPKRTVIE